MHVVATLGDMPRMVPVMLFGDEFGQLYTSPIAIIGIAMLVWILVARFRSRLLTRAGIGMALGVAAYVGFGISAVIGSHSRGMDYGWRYLFSFVPLGWLGYVLWERDAVPGARSLWRRGVAVVLFGLTTFSIMGQVLHGAAPGLRVLSPNYESSLLRAIGSRDAWERIVVGGFPGYLAIKAFPQSGDRLAAVADRLDVRSGFDVFNRNTTEPPRIRHPLLVAPAVWFPAGRWLLWPARAGAPPPFGFYLVLSVVGLAVL